MIPFATLEVAEDEEAKGPVIPPPVTELFIDCPVPSPFINKNHLPLLKHSFVFHYHFSLHLSQLHTNPLRL
jgi:hypothetical protein